MNRSTDHSIDQFIDITHGPTRSSDRGLFSWLTVIVSLIAASTLTGITVAAVDAGGGRELAPVTERDPVRPVVQDAHFLACMRTGSLVADRLEERVPRCRAISQLTAACLAGAAKSPDAQEQWVSVCRAQASEALD